MGDRQAMAGAMEAALRTGDFRQMGEIIQRYGADDFVQEWPQSGERMTKEAALKVGEQYPTMAGATPSFNYRRMLSGGDVIVVEGTIDYGDGVPVSYVGIGELRGDQIARITEYFANPFEAPAWRAGLTERMDAVKA